MKALRLKALESGEYTDQINIKIDAACTRYSRGRASMMADASAAGALIRIGRSVLVNVPKMDIYYSALAGE